MVLEVDGKHHFSENDHPPLRIYVGMVSADHALRLAGYEVYRFGANELVGEGAESGICSSPQSSYPPRPVPLSTMRIKANIRVNT